MPTTILKESLLQKGLSTKCFGRKIYVFETIDSTNTCAKALAGGFAPEGAVVIAEEQTAGRGRVGRVWRSTPGENLTFSFVLRPSVSPSSVNLLPLLASVAVVEAIERETGLRPDCKWPNDILIRGRKTCGILLEGSLKEEAFDHVVAGIGLNVNQVEFPDDLKESATSLRLEKGEEIDRVQLFRTILVRFEELYLKHGKTQFEEIPTLWLRHSSMLNKEVAVTVGESIVRGTVLGLSADGALQIRTDTGETKILAGDVVMQQAIIEAAQAQRPKTNPSAS